MGRLARRLREPFLPWQQYAADVAMELDPATGRWLHETVAVLVARQNGKTRLLKNRIAAELLYFRGRRVLHTAQDRAVPRELFLELWETLARSPRYARRIAEIRKANGQEMIRLTNGSEYRILAPQQDRFRSWPATLIVFDEAREHRSLELGEAARPTLATARRPQIWYVSNAGDPASLRLNVIKARGEKSLEDPDADPGICYLEWSSPTDDPGDVDGWEQANPGLGRLIQPASLVEHLRDADAAGDYAGFITERLCRWVDATAATAVPLDAWAACRQKTKPKPFKPGTDRMVLALDVDPERRTAAMIAVGFRRGKLLAQVVERWEDPNGVDDDQIAADVTAWALKWTPEAIGYDPFTCSGIAAIVEAAYPVGVEAISGTKYLTACAQLWDAAVNNKLRHMGDPWLDAQIAAAGRKPHGDGTWRIARLESGVPIPGVMALARALHLAYRPRIVPEVL